MSEESNNLPQTATAEELAWNRIRPYLLDPRENYPEPYYMLEYNGVPFSKIGGMGAMSGQKKNGKSFVFTELIAAIVGDGCERVQQYLPGLRVPERTIEFLGHKPRALYIDTEMEEANTIAVKINSESFLLKMEEGKAYDVTCVPTLNKGAKTLGLWSKDHVKEVKAE